MTRPGHSTTTRNGPGYAQVASGMLQASTSSAPTAGILPDKSQCGSRQDLVHRRSLTECWEAIKYCRPGRTERNGWLGRDMLNYWALHGHSSQMIGGSSIPATPRGAAGPGRQRSGRCTDGCDRRRASYLVRCARLSRLQRRRGRLLRRQSAAPGRRLLRSLRHKPLIRRSPPNRRPCRGAVDRWIVDADVIISQPGVQNYCIEFVRLLIAVLLVME